jgi:ribonuclease P protein component
MDAGPPAMHGRPPARLVNKADFERLLAARSQGRSAHFALHHVNATPAEPGHVAKAATTWNLSTDTAPQGSDAVDKLPDRIWYGCVVPKRHARRAVTRNLIKRQMRGAFQRHGATLAAGLWLLRLRAPFAPAHFVSARSAALAGAARGELDGLLAQAAA